MRYTLTLFLIVFVLSSEIINKADEIKEFAEYEDIELQFLFRTISFFPLFKKIAIEGIELCNNAMAFILSTDLFKYVKNVVIASRISHSTGNSYYSKGKALLAKLQIFKNGNKIFEKGLEIYNKYSGLFKNSKIDKNVINIIDKVNQSEIYHTYKKMNDTYNKAKDTYDKIKDYY